MEREHTDNNSESEEAASPSPSGSNADASSTINNDKKSKNETEEDENEMFHCNVCFETASEPVVTLCGHLFCWPCIYRWFEVHRSDETTCPVCKSGIAKSNLVPIYGRGKDKVDPRTKIPSRPAGQRSEAPEQASIMGPNDHFLPPGLMMGGGGNLGGVQINFGGPFPFMGWGNINFGGGQQRAPANLTPAQRQRMQQDNISRMLLFLGFVVLLWVLPLWRSY